MIPVKKRDPELGRYRVLIDGQVVMSCQEANEAEGYIISSQGQILFGRVKVMDRKAERVREQRTQAR